jgi:adenosine deaminase
MTNYSQLPKVELHLHLDCCLSYQAVHQLDPSVTPESYRHDFVAPAKCTNLAHYLETTRNSVALLQSEDALRLAVVDLFEQLAQDQVIYAEIRFAPLLHTRRGLKPERIVQVVEEETIRCSVRTGIEARVLLCTLRHFSEEQSLQTVRLVEAFRGSRVVALDIAGDEAGFPIDAHVPAFRYAIERGIPRIAHAGEARGADSVWETLQHFQPMRIGHGVRSLEDAELVKHLRESQMHLEICPKCNVQTDIVPAYPDHPIDRLYQAGLSLGVNTDTRTVTDVTLNQEYEQLSKVFGWDAGGFLACNLNALAASFAPSELKERLMNQLRVAYPAS